MKAIIEYGDSVKWTKWRREASLVRMVEKEKSGLSGLDSREVLMLVASGIGLGREAGNVAEF